MSSPSTFTLCLMSRLVGGTSPLPASIGGAVSVMGFPSSPPGARRCAPGDPGFATSLAAASAAADYPQPVASLHLPVATAFPRPVVLPRLAAAATATPAAATAASHFPVAADRSAARRYRPVAVRQAHHLLTAAAAAAAR